jgi:hypothetical protein
MHAAGRFRTLGIALDANDLKGFLAKHSVEFEVITDIPQEQQRAYKMGNTPHTLVISQQARVLASWPGLYSPNLRKAIEEFFGVSLVAPVGPR